MLPKIFPRYCLRLSKCAHQAHADQRQSNRHHRQIRPRKIAQRRKPNEVQRVAHHSRYHQQRARPNQPIPASFHRKSSQIPTQNCPFQLRESRPNRDLQRSLAPDFLAQKLSFQPKSAADSVAASDPYQSATTPSKSNIQKRLITLCHLNFCCGFALPLVHCRRSSNIQNSTKFGPFSLLLNARARAFSAS